MNLAIIMLTLSAFSTFQRVTKKGQFEALKPTNQNEFGFDA